MKKMLKLLGVLSFAILLVAACSDDDDPKDNDLFVGTYKGKVSYTKSGTKISEKEGSVTVIKTGDKYTFKFSDDIPTLKSIKIKKGENKFDIGWGEGSLITIDAKSLKILMIKDGARWTADCKR